MSNLKKYTKELQRRHTILKLLSENYPSAQCTLNYQSAYQLLVATILSAQCTDVMVNKVTPKLFSVAPTPQAMVNLPLPELETIIKPTGFFVHKSRLLKKMSSQLLEQFRGEVPSTMDDLLKLSGVGRKTASVVLGAFWGKAEGIVVDTHVRRLSQRLKLAEATTPDKIESELMSWVPKESWISISHQLITHGRLICLARSPKCSHCFLSNYCPSANTKNDVPNSSIKVKKQ